MHILHILAASFHSHVFQSAWFLIYITLSVFSKCVWLDGDILLCELRQAVWVVCSGYSYVRMEGIYSFSEAWDAGLCTAEDGVLACLLNRREKPS